MPVFFYPNRPTLIPADPINPMNPSPDYINSLEDSGRYIAEKKYNGDNVLCYSPTEFWNRHKSKHRYKPTEEVRDELERLPQNAVYNIELVNYRTKTVKQLLIVHCVMTWKGKPLLGKTWGYSRKILENEVQSGKHVVLSPVWKKDFWELYQAADGNDIEGIILKKPTGKLVFSATPITDVPWMLKIRKPSKKYSF